MDIKQFKPSKNSRFTQGYIDPSTCKKLFESIQNQPVIYRSSWEKRFVKWCESCKRVKQWGSECVSIRYYLPTDEKWHTYYPDFLVQMEDGTMMVVEIKPLSQVEKPNSANEWATRTYVKNMSKWRTIKSACETRGYKFCILTENTINKL